MNRIEFGNHITMIFKHRWLAGIILILLMDICTYMAFVSSGATPTYINDQDKILHAAAFCLLFVVGYISLNFDFFPRIRKPSAPLLITTWLALTAYGAFIEVVQGYLVYRSSSVADLIADIVGLTLGSFLVIGLKLHPKSGEATPP